MANLLTSTLNAFTGLLGFQAGQNRPLDGAQSRLAIDLRRLAKYQWCWSEYYGVALDQMTTEDKSPAVKVNFIKKNIDKIVYFAFGNGFTPTNPDYQDVLTNCMKAWGRNPIEKLTRIGQFGSVAGDAFVMVAPVDVATQMVQDAGAQIPAALNSGMPSSIRMVVINSEYCTPTYHPFDADVLIRMDINIPYQLNTSATDTERRVQHMEIYQDKVLTSVNDREGRTVPGTATTVPNPVGEIYVIHVRNYPTGDSVFGGDDIQEASALNRTLVDNMTTMNNILAYHSAPTIALFGARAGQLQRGPNKIWGNLPANGKVELLELKGKMQPANEYMDRVTQRLHEVMGVPEIAQGSSQAISNTSGIALQTMYLPLLERARVKQSIYGPMFVEMLILVAKWMVVRGVKITTEDGSKKKMPKLTDDDYENIRTDTLLNFPVPLPKDDLVETQVQSARLAASLQTIPDALRALGEANPELKAKEIEAEKKAHMETFGSMPGGPPAKPVADGSGSGTGGETPADKKPVGRPSGTTKS